MYRKLPEIFPIEPPALLHGDLWRGNYMVRTNSQPILIDPAIYYGHREVDIAMTRLFGGFDPSFYAVYHEAYPLEADWQKRVDIYNLYPLLVHLNLVGHAYLEPLKAIVERFG